MMGGEIPLILDKLIMNIYDDYYSFYEKAIILIYVFVCLLHLQLSSLFMEATVNFATRYKK